jgi:hypothetical protein
MILLMASYAIASFSEYSSPYSGDSVVAPIQIKDEGIYNLVISIQFLNEPYDNKQYKSDAYENYIRRVKVEWAGIALSQVLSAKEQTINDLVGLKTNIETEITKLADRLKGKYSLDKNLEVVFSLSNFYLLEPKAN